MFIISIHYIPHVRNDFYHKYFCVQERFNKINCSALNFSSSATKNISCS